MFAIATVNMLRAGVARRTFAACAAQCEVQLTPDALAAFKQAGAPLSAAAPAGTESTVTYVRKITTSGNECGTCAKVSKKLEQDGLFSVVDRVVDYDERNPLSEGLQLAAAHKQRVTPFFVIQEPDNSTKVLTMYSQLKKVLIKRKQEVGSRASTGSDFSEFF